MSCGTTWQVVLPHGIWDYYLWSLLNGTETGVIFFMEHQQIFATNIFLLDDFISEFHSINLGMKKYIGDLWNERDYDNNWQTKSADWSKNQINA